MTEEEIGTLELLAQAWNAFLELPEVHQDDRNDFRKSIHDAQRLVMARSGHRALHALGLSSNTDDVYDA